MSSILLPFVEIIITFPEDHVHLSMRFFAKIRAFRHPVIKRVIKQVIKYIIKHSIKENTAAKLLLKERRKAHSARLPEER